MVWSREAELRRSRSAGELRRLRAGIVVIGVLAILAFAGSTAYDAWRSYRHTLTATDREIRNVAKALAEQAAQGWQSVDLLLRDTARWVGTDSAEIAPERLDQVLTNRVAGVRQVRYVTIVDAQGVQRHRSRGQPQPDLRVSDRSYFIAQRDRTVSGIFMSEPLVTRSESRPGVVLSRRVEDRNGAFAGVVTAVLDLEDLGKFYGDVGLGTGSSIELLREDGTLLVHNPPQPGAVGRKFPALATLVPAPATRLIDPTDGKRVFVVVAPVRDTPLRLAVTREVGVALRAWRDETLRAAARTLVVTVLGAWTIVALLRQLRRIGAGETALLESEERYALAMEGANEGHWDWNIASGHLFLSPKMKMLHGKSAEAEVTTHAAWLSQIAVHPDDLPRFEAARRDHLEGRTPHYDCEYRVRSGDGEWRWLHSRGRCLRDPSGKPCRFVGSAIDITAQKQAQIDKDHLEAQLRQSQKLEAIGTLAGGIAHDFNNILGAILGYGELAHQHSGQNPPLRRYLDNVMHAAGRAKALVDRILGFSRSGLGERVPVNVQSIIEETVELLRASLPAGIRLESRLEAGNAAVIGDPTHLHQVAMNLCTNALQAMERGGGVLSVTLERVEVTERGSHSRGTLSPGPHLRLLVSDTGTGIPSAVLERMFDPFFTTKGVGAGTGLGLSLVHGIVTDLGGAIDVTTKAGEGASFAVWLPVAGEAARPTLETAGEIPRGNHQTVLIVDDEPLLVTLCEEMLAEIDYEPVGFRSSTQALQRFRADPGRFDVVLTDETMPELTGTELAREIRRLRPDLPIVLVSGHGGTQLAERAAEVGVNELLRKPLQVRDLAESLARVLGRVERARGVLA